MTKLPVFSASQVSTYEACPRKWAWQKIANLPSPPNKYAAFGTAVHSHLEDWLTKRVVPEGGELAAQVASAMLPHLPAPQAVSPDAVEKEFRWQFDDVMFRGFMDLALVDGEQITIYDHKTTSDLLWAKTPEDLVEDVQATLYARVLMDEHNVNRVNLQWTYATRKPRTQVQPVRCSVTREQILPRVQQTVASAREMKLILESGCAVEEVPYDAAACEAFGGCPFQTNCNLSTQQRIQSAMSQETAKNSFLQRLQARKAATGAAPVAAAPVAAAVNPPEAAPISSPEPTPTFDPPPSDRTPGAAMIAAMLDEPEPVIAPKRGPGRPRKDGSAPIPAKPVAAVAAVAAPPARQETASVSAPVAAVAAKAGWVLYLDCAPIKGLSVEHVSERLARVMLAYTAETGQSHYKLTEYGKGPALFAEGFARDLAENPPKAGIVANTASQEVRDVLQVLTAAAAVVVQG